MSRAKSKQIVKPAPVTSQPETAGLYEIRLAPFLGKYSIVLALCLVAIASLRIAATYPVLSLTADEPAHFACGLEFLQKHVYRYEPQHPPLARMMTALGPYLEGARLRGDFSFGEEGVEVIVHSRDPQRTVNLMRLGILPFFWLACLVVFFWARRVSGAPVAVIATGLFTMIPTVLAHAGLATTDMALAACLGAAFYSLLLWAETPNWKHGLLLGVATAFAALSKFTALGFLPAAALLALILYLLVKSPGWKELAELTRTRAVTFGLAVLTGAIVIWAGYWFSYGKVPGWDLSLPAPEFFDGIRFAMSHNSKGHPAFLLGEISDQGWWYYFPVALAVKTPIALLLLIFVGMWQCWKNRARAAYLAPAAFSLGILFTAMTSRVNIGVRHILPVYIGFAIMAAVALAHLLRKAKGIPWAAIVLVAWTAASGSIRHADYLAYFNELVLSHPEDVLVDSDLDWAQDVIHLSRRLRELGVTKVAFNVYPPLIPLYHLPACERVNLSAPTETWTVIRPTDAKYVAWGMRRRPWYEGLEPTERVGALLLFRSGR
jgi:dolichyl-phosphate-mannose-protein mannosyltransferase